MSIYIIPCYYGDIYICIYLVHVHVDMLCYFLTHSDGDKLVPSVQKKINELEVGLLHLQQNIDIPEISLPIHPTIQAVVKKAADGGRKPNAEALSDSLGDSTYLNALQKDVSRWIREIQKVSRRGHIPVLSSWLGTTRGFLIGALLDVHMCQLWLGFLYQRCVVCGLVAVQLHLLYSGSVGWALSSFLS